MSYLDLPRLHICGRFFCDPSSINNDPVAYLPETTRPAPWQMPKGTHSFRFFDCKIMTALDAAGGTAADPGLIGASFRSTDAPVPGKIVDLDVYQQGVTQLIGVQIAITTSDGELKGTMRPPVLNGGWFAAVLPTRGWATDYGSAGSYGADSSALGVFQTVVEVAEADWNIRTPAMEALRQRCQVAKNSKGATIYLLAFKFVLDGYWNVAGSIEFQKGRVVGTLGPQLAKDPIETLGARWLEARDPPPDIQWFVPQFYRAPFRIDTTRNVLQIDWSGSFSRVSFGGDPVSLGDVRVMVANVELGKVTFDARGYRMSAGITELPLTREQAALLANAPLELWTSREDIGPRRIFAEAADGIAIATQNRCIRMTSEPTRDTSRAVATAVLRRFGKPIVGVTPNLAVVPVHGTTPGATVPPTNPGDTPEAEGALGATISASDADGISTITFTALKNPGSRTPELDGQLYFASVYFGDTAPKAPLQEVQVSVLLWSQDVVKKTPTWADIQPLMAPYAKLYPAMKDKFDLANQEAFNFYSNNPDAAFFFGPGGKFAIPGHPEIQNGTIPFLISLPFDDPRYMPVTRDLSPPKVETLLNYISIEQAKITSTDGTPGAEA